MRMASVFCRPVVYRAAPIGPRGLLEEMRFPPLVLVVKLLLLYGSY